MTNIQMQATAITLDPGQLQAKLRGRLIQPFDEG